MNMVKRKKNSNIHCGNAPKILKHIWLMAWQMHCRLINQSDILAESQQQKQISITIPTLMGGVNGGSEIVKMWTDYIKG